MKWLQVIFLVICGLAALIATGSGNRLGHRARRQVLTDGASAVTASPSSLEANQNAENPPNYSGAEAPGGGWGGGGGGWGGGNGGWGWGWGK